MSRAFDVIIIGGGVAGREASRRLATLGAHAAIVERKRQALRHVPQASGLKPYHGIGRLVGVGLVEVSAGSKRTLLKAQSIILATGSITSGPLEAGSERWLEDPPRRPCLEDLGVEGLGIERDAEGFLFVDDRCRTRIPEIFAAGDVTGWPFTPRKAREEGKVAAGAALGQPDRLRFRFWPVATPGGAFAGCRPRDVPTGARPRMGSARCGEADQVFVTVDLQSDRVISCRAIGPRAPRLINHIVRLINQGTAASTIASTMQSKSDAYRVLAAACRDALNFAPAPD